MKVPSLTGAALAATALSAAVNCSTPLAAAATKSVSALAAFHHVPPYPNHVLGIEIQNRPSASGGSYVIKTSDSVEAVTAWYKRHLPDQNGDKKTLDGHHIFFTKNGSTVDVGRANLFEGNYTIIGVVTSK